VIPLRTQRNSTQYERRLREQYGDAYAAVIAKAGTIRSTRRMSSGATLTEAQNARNDGLEEGLLLAGREVLKCTGISHHEAEDTARSAIAHMASAVEQDEHEFLNHPAWQRPRSTSAVA